MHFTVVSSSKNAAVQTSLLRYFTGWAGNVTENPQAPPPLRGRVRRFVCWSILTDVRVRVCKHGHDEIITTTNAAIALSTFTTSIYIHRWHANQIVGSVTTREYLRFSSCDENSHGLCLNYKTSRIPYVFIEYETFDEYLLMNMGTWDGHAGNLYRAHPSSLPFRCSAYFAR